MNATTILMLVLAGSGQVPVGAKPPGGPAAKARSERLRELHTADAASFSIFRDNERQQNSS